MEKKLLIIGIILMILLVFLSGCGEKSSEKKDNNESIFSTY